MMFVKKKKYTAARQSLCDMKDDIGAFLAVFKFPQGFSVRQYTDAEGVDYYLVLNKNNFVGTRARSLREVAVYANLFPYGPSKDSIEV